MTTPANSGDAAMLTWLAGDQAVVKAARRVWDATGAITNASDLLVAAQDELHAATSAYAESIRAARIPPEHAERLGAALIFRLSRHHLDAELYGTWPEDDQP